MIIDNETGQYKQKTNFHIALKSLKETIVTKYKKDLHSLLQEIQQYDDETATFTNRLFRKIFNLIICIILLLLSTIISILGKYIYVKFQRHLNIVERRVNNLQDVYLGEEN